MLHDLLFSLLGKPGSFIRQDNDSPFYVDESLQIFSRCEVIVLNNIISIGYNYQQVDKFLKEFQEQPSAYIRALCYSIDYVLQEYRQLILRIEQDYLREKTFTVAQLNIQLAPYQSILLNLFTTITITKQHDLRGGQIIDYLHERTHTGNPNLVNIYNQIINICYSVLYQQLQQWLLYGQILDTFEEFIIQRIDEKKQHNQGNQEYNWDTSFTLNVQMIPLHYISLQVAEKILFIGKAVKVLKSQQEYYIPDNVEQIKYIEHFNQFQFNNIIDDVYRFKGKQLVKIIQEKYKLFENLDNLFQFVLIHNGNFFQNFLQESYSILSLPQTQYALQELNLNISKLDIEQADKLSLIIHNNGFDYKNFNSLNNLQIKNNVLKTVNILRLGPSRSKDDWSGVFRDLKQSIENGFTMQVVFKFKQNYQKQQLSGYSVLQTDQPKSTVMVIIFCSDQQEDQAVYLKLVHEDQKGSYISLEIKTRVGEEILYKWKLDDVNFQEGDLHSLKVVYQNDELSMILNDTNQGADNISRTDTLKQSTWVKFQFKFQKYIQLELGRCLLGIKCFGYMIDLCSWKMIGSNFLSDSYWSGLTLKYQIDYPLSLLITPALQEKIQLFFRYLFPIKHVQYELQQLWIKLNRKYKDIKYRSVLVLHSQLINMVNAFYSYFQMDIISVQWERMINRLKNEDGNFEMMKKILSDFEISVSNQLFLNLQQIVKSIFSLVKFANKYIELTQRIDFDKQININKECLKIKVEFDDQFMALFNLITLLSKSTNQLSLFQLLTRLDYNGYYSNKISQEFNI